MRLDTHEGTFADPASVEDIARAVAGLTDADEAFIVLISGHEDDETYVQAAGAVAENFLVERREGRAGDHYRGDRRVSAGALVDLFVAYLRRSPDWSRAIEWHRVRVDGAHINNAPSA